MRIGVLAALAVMGAAQSAVAQSTDVRSMTHGVVAEVCLPFWASQALDKASAEAGPLGFRVRDVEIREGETEPHALRLSAEPGGNRLILATGDSPLCSLTIPEGTVALMAEMTGPLVEAAGYTPVSIREVGTGPDVFAWRRDDDFVVVARDAESGRSTVLFRRGVGSRLPWE